MTVRILVGDCRERLLELPDDSVHCVVTSPPYWGLRSYDHPDQMGLEPSPDEYVAALVEVFREVRRVLRPDGVAWLNLGDSYAGSWGNYSGQNRGKGKQRPITTGSEVPQSAYVGLEKWRPPASRRLVGIKDKELVGIPWMTAFALRADGWRLRQDVIWAKPNPIPESIKDRCTRSHEHVFLLTKSKRYWFDHHAIMEPSQSKPTGRKRHKRDVWTVANNGSGGLATMPPELARPCILAGCPVGGVVLDPFAGSGTTLLVADRLGRDAIGVELNLDYVQMMIRRLNGDAPLLVEVTVE